MVTASITDLNSPNRILTKFGLRPMSAEIHLTTELILGIIGTSVSILAMVYSYTNSAKRLEHRLTTLELKIEPIWDAVRREIPKLLISNRNPRHSEFDELVQKAMRDQDMTNIEVTRLLHLLESEYQKAVEDSDKGRAVGIALFRATVRRPER